jgi:hypothetical protein
MEVSFLNDNFYIWICGGFINRVSPWSIYRSIRQKDKAQWKIKIPYS